MAAAGSAVMEFLFGSFFVQTDSVFTSNKWHLTYYYITHRTSRHQQLRRHQCSQERVYTRRGPQQPTALPGMGVR